MIFSLETAKRIGHRYRGLGRFSRWVSPSLEMDLIRSELEIHPDEYRFASFASAAFFGVIVFALMTLLLFVFTQELRSSIYMSLLAGLVPFAMVFIVLLRYPKIIAGKEAEQVDKNLVYALKDMLLSISSGLSIFKAITLVSRGSYGFVSKDLKHVVDRVNTGAPIEEAMEELAISTPSEHFQSVLWQIVNTSKSGADVEGVLRSLIENLVSEQKSDIQKYSHELNVLTLMYMLAAVAVPTIITTLMIILNAFISTGISEWMFIGFLMVSISIQVTIVGLVKSRRPMVHI